MGKYDEKYKMHEEICELLNSVYSEKNEDYDDSFSKSFNAYGMAMPCIRLEDKLNRFKALTVQNKEQKFIGESVVDTLMDLANYAIMTIIEINNKNI